MMVITMQGLGTDAIREPEGWEGLLLWITVPGPVALEWWVGLSIHSLPGPASVPGFKGKAAYSLPEINTRLFGLSNLVPGPGQPLLTGHRKGPWKELRKVWILPALYVTAWRGLAQGTRLGWQIQRQTVLPTQQPPGRKSGANLDGNHMPVPCVFALQGKNLVADSSLGLRAELTAQGGRKLLGRFYALDFRKP